LNLNTESWGYCGWKSRNVFFIETFIRNFDNIRKFSYLKLSNDVENCEQKVFDLLMLKMILFTLDSQLKINQDLSVQLISNY
jgi:hypothetical protein